MKHIVLTTLAIAFSTFCSAGPLYADAGKPVLLEAEDHKADANVNEDETALGSQYVHQSKGYNPFFFMPIPEALKDSVIIWARVRGCAVQLKSSTSGQDGQIEHSWKYDKPAEWTWVKLANKTREELGDTILLIVGPSPAENSGVDAVIFTADEAYEPQVEKNFDAIRQTAK